MDMRNVFPSKYLKASDLQDRDATVVIETVQMADVGGNDPDDEKKEKPLIHFKGKEKGLILNVTNTNTIIDLYGPDSTDWLGQPITLFPTQTDFQGRATPCIRVRIRKPPMPDSPAPAPTPPPAPSPLAGEQHLPVDESSIPF